MGIINRAGAMYMATGIDNTGLYTGKREAMGIIKAMAGEITSFDIFGGIGVSAAVTFARAAKDAYTFEKDFQKSMYEVASISGTIKGSLTSYMNSIMDMTRQIPVAANESAKALYQIVSAGHDGANAMKILEVSAKAAIGGVTDTATAADAITTVLNAYKMSAGEASKVSDMLFMTAKLGKTTMGELGQTIAQAAPIAASYGVGIDQVLSAVASLTKQGTPTAQAMTQIRASILGVSKVLGDGVFDGRTYQEALAEVAERAGGSESKLRALVPEVEAVNAVLGMTGNNAMSAASDLDELGNSLGASETAFKTMQKSADNQLKLLQNNIISTFRPLGEGILEEVAGAAQKMNEAFSSGDIKSSMQTMETLIKLVSVAFVGYKVATMDSLKTTNAEATATEISTAIKAAYHKVIGDGIVQKETERLSQEAYVASLESSITMEQRASLEKMNLKKGSKEYSDALSEIAINSKRSADQEVESISKSLEKNRDKLSSVKERVEMSKAATEAAKGELDAALQANDISATEAAQSKVISAAKREESAVNEMNTVSRKINNQEKRLGIAQVRAESASTVLNNATTASNTVATTMSTRAHGFLAAAKLKAAIATNTLTAAIAANPIGAVLTVISLAATAWLMFSGNTERAKTKLQEFREEQDKLKESTNSLINTLYDGNEADRVRIDALEKLKGLYPDVWKGITLENLALRDRNKVLKETNTLREKEAEIILKNQINSLSSAIKTKEFEASKIKTDMVSKSTKGHDITREMSDFTLLTEDIKKQRKELSNLERQYYKVQSAKQKLIEENLPVDARISIYEKELKDLQIQIEKATGAKKEFSLTDWGDAPKLPTFEDIPQFADQFNIQLLENRAKEVKEKLEADRKLQNSSKSGKTSTSLTDAEKREAEKRKNTLEDIAKTVLGIELKTQQDRVSIMAEGREKALAEIDVDKKARLQAIDDAERELSKKYVSTGQKMPQHVTSEFAQQRQSVNADAGYKSESVNKDYDRQEIEFQKELSSVFLTEEEKRKQATQDRYDSLRRAQKEAYDNDIRNIEQSKTSEEEAAKAKTKAQVKYNAVIAGINKAQTLDETKGLLNEYQGYTDQRLAIENKFNADIASLQESRKKYEIEGNTEMVQQIDRAIAQATTNKGKDLMSLDYQQLKQTPDYVRAFENLKETSSDTLDSLLSQLENAKQTAAQVLSPDQLREYTTTIQEIMDELDSRNPWQSLSDKKLELAEAEQELAQAQIELENARQQVEAVKGGAKIENGVNSSKYNQKTGKIDSTKAYLTEAQALDKVKVKTDNYNKSKDKVVEKSVKVKKSEKDVTDQIDELSKAISDVGNSIGGPAGEIISLIGDIGSFTMFTMEGIKAVADTSANAISQVEKASVILAIISTAIQVATKIASMFKGEDEEEKRERYIDQLNGVVEIYDKIIEKQKESIKFGYGFSAIESAKKAMEELNKQTETYRNIAYEAGNKLMSFSKIGIWANIVKEMGIEAHGDDLLSSRLLSSLTGEQLLTIRDKYKEFWATLPEEQQKALQAIIDAEEKGKEVIDAWQEAITGISYESFYDEFIGTLSDMDTSAADMAENFGEYLRKSILSAMVAKNFQKDIDGLYDKWVAAGDEKSDGGLDITEDEAKNIQDEYKKLADAMVKKREEMEKLYGWESEAKKEGVTGQLQAAVTEGTASQLVGLWNMTALDIRAIKDLTAEHFRQSKPYMLNVESVLAETRQINANTKRTADNTGGIIEELRDGFSLMKTELAEIKNNTKTSKSRG